MVSFDEGQSRRSVGTGLLLGPTIVLVEITWVEDVGVDDVGVAAIEDGCALDCVLCGLPLLLSLSLLRF